MTSTVPKLPTIKHSQRYLETGLMGRIDQRYILKQAAQAATGCNLSLWRIASHTDFFEDELCPNGDLAEDQIEQIREWVKGYLRFAAASAQSLDEIDRLNLETAYPYFCGEDNAC